MVWIFSNDGFYLLANVSALIMQTTKNFCTLAPNNCDLCFSFIKTTFVRDLNQDESVITFKVFKCSNKILIFLEYSLLIIIQVDKKTHDTNKRCKKIEIESCTSVFTL